MCIARYHRRPGEHGRKHGDRHGQMRHRAQRHHHGERHEGRRWNQKSRGDIAEVIHAEDERGKPQVAAFPSAQREQSERREQEHRTKQAR